jgi:hypothetical protein
MEWVFLLLVVPAVVAPIVVLFRFAGCKFDPQAALNAPVVEVAIPLQPRGVVVRWRFISQEPATFEAERTRADDPPAPVFPAVALPAPGEPGKFLFTESDLDEGTRYTYRFRTVRSSDGEQSVFSDPVAIETWGPVFSGGLEQIGVDDVAVDSCIVQRLSPGSLARGGNLIAITVRAAGTGNVDFTHVTISRAALAGDDFDSEGIPTDITAQRVSVMAGSALPLPPVEFNVDADEPLLVAFDVDDPGLARVARGVSHTAYVKRPLPGDKITDARNEDRTGFTEQPSELWFIDRVDIATQWPPIP